MSELSKGRIEWVDAAKGYGMFLVILGHIGFGKLNTWIYSFHMPLFFFLSGFLFSRKSSFREFFIRKCKTLLIPYFCLGILTILLDAAMKVNRGSFSFDFLKSSFISLLVQKRYKEFWFIGCVFILNLMLYFLTSVCKKDRHLIFAVLVLTVLGLLYSRKYYKIYLPWNLEVCFPALFFYAGGYLFRKYYSFFNTRLFQKAKGFRLCAAGLFLIIGVGFMLLSLKLRWMDPYEYTVFGNDFGYSMYMARSWYGFEAASFLSALGGIFFLLLMAQLLPLNFVDYTGRNSICYLAFQNSLITHLLRVSSDFRKTLSGYAIWGYNIVIFVLTFLTLTAFCYILSKKPFKFMLGK